MARKSLRPQLNTIRTWVRQGRTDAWIAHQLEIDAAQLREFKRQHDLEADGEGNGEGDVEIDLRDEIEAEVEAAQEAAAEPEPDEPAEAGGEEPEGGRRRRRRRGGRRGRRGKKGGGPYEATFDHGETDGYGLWLDPAVAEDPIYSDKWAGHRPVTVTIEAERIVIQRLGPGGEVEGDETADIGDDRD